MEVNKRNSSGLSIKSKNSFINIWYKSVCAGKSLFAFVTTTGQNMATPTSKMVKPFVLSKNPEGNHINDISKLMLQESHLSNSNAKASFYSTPKKLFKSKEGSAMMRSNSRFNSKISHLSNLAKAKSM